MATNIEDKNEELEKVLSTFDFWKPGEVEEVIELKNPVLNAMLHGGLPKRSIIQIAANSGVGKSTLVIQMAKELCQLGYNVVYIDAEKGLNTNMLKSTGIYSYLNNIDKSKGGRFSIALTADCGEINVLIQDLCNKGLADFIILDSLGALDSGIYEKGGSDANNPKVGADTRSLKIVMKTMNKMCLNHKIGFIFINHLSPKIGSYIPTDDPTGGRAPQYLSDVIIKLTRAGDLETPDKDKIGQKVNYEILKSRRGRGKCKIPFYIRFGQGIAMIPTYREILENVEVEFNGEKKNILEIRGGGNGSLFINNVELKFRGENQLLNLIAENYSYIKNIISWDYFAPSEEKLPDWATFNENIEIKTYTSTVPEEFEKLKVVKTEVNKIYFDDGIDSDGQKYSIHYNTNSERLVLEYNSTSEEINNPNLDDYKALSKKLKKYLKDL